ncbi:MAG: hypothetical protein LBE74_05455 [Treponema sp.]|nr:hypothetical protein [Treponema sp.]
MNANSILKCSSSPDDMDDNKHRFFALGIIDDEDDFDDDDFDDDFDDEDDFDDDDDFDGFDIDDEPPGYEGYDDE